MLGGKLPPLEGKEGRGLILHEMNQATKENPMAERFVVSPIST